MGARYSVVVMMGVISVTLAHAETNPSGRYGAIPCADWNATVNKADQVEMQKYAQFVAWLSGYLSILETPDQKTKVEDTPLRTIVLKVNQSCKSDPEQYVYEAVISATSQIIK